MAGDKENMKLVSFINDKYKAEIVNALIELYKVSEEKELVMVLISNVINKHD